jgi:hypothetical protein
MKITNILFPLFFLLCSSLFAQLSADKLTMEIDGDDWEPVLARAEYKATPSGESVSVSMFRPQGDDLTILDKLSIRMVRFEGEKAYKVGETYLTLCTLFQHEDGEKVKYNVVPGSGEVKVTAYDPKSLSISGTFSFKLKSSLGDEELEVTDGVFKNLKLLDVSPEEEEEN